MKNKKTKKKKKKKKKKKSFTAEQRSCISILFSRQHVSVVLHSLLFTPSPLPSKQCTHFPTARSRDFHHPLPMPRWKAENGQHPPVDFKPDGREAHRQLTQPSGPGVHKADTGDSIHGDRLFCFSVVKRPSIKLSICQGRICFASLRMKLMINIVISTS